MSRSVLMGLLGILTFAHPALGEAPPVPPEKAAARMRMPEGFRAALVAGEPRLVKPIAMTTDDRGRLWVVESHSYPNWITDGHEGHDRVLIFEDTKGDGHYDCTVFWDKGTNLSGIAMGFGGVWLCATPNLLFLPVRPGEDRPAGPPQVVLDGWSLKARHNVFNGLTWGPDGWLYGCNGILGTASVGRPGTPESQRVQLNCGVWRYHPIKRRFEPFAWGTTNPWGLDFDDRGEMFITNCVIKHLFHVIPGAHYERMYGQDLNPHCYGLMASCADHIHWAGGHWTGSRGNKPEHSASGGGHAHAGALVYLGDNWPDSYRNHIFLCNLHGNRVNQDVLERHGSGYVAHHGPDFLMANDSWFRGLALRLAPDGGVFVSDWHDTGECHDNDRVEPCGRIFKVTHGRPRPVATDLEKCTDEELVRLQLHRNDWWVRHARRLLQERAHAGKLNQTVRSQLVRMLSEQTDVTRRLRALWALHGIGGLDEKALLGLLGDSQAAVRGWAVRLALEELRASDALAARLVEMGRRDRSAPVRLALASALQRLPLAQRWPLAEALASHAEDAADANLPLMIWYGIEPLVPADPDRAARLLARARIPLVREHIARRITLLADRAVGPLVKLLTDSADGGVQRDVLRGMHEALQGRRHVPAPEGWSAVNRKLTTGKDADVRERALVLSVLFGDPRALAALRKSAADPASPTTTRQNALQTLVEKRSPDLLPLLRTLLNDRVMRGAALRGLAAYNDPGTPALVLRHYAELSDAEKADAIGTLASRPAYALELLEAMERGQVPRRDLSSFTARQLLGCKDRRVTERLSKVWGSIRPPSKDRAALLAKYRKFLAPDALKNADRSRGRLVFSRTCASCHTLFDAGGKIGPDLTGSQRANPEYILTKVLDPNAAVARDYQVTAVTTRDGRVVNGIVKQETDRTLTLQTPTEIVRLPKSEIEERRLLAVSMMPEGQLTPMSDAEVRNLLAYLAGPGQVPLPREADGSSPRPRTPAGRGAR